MKQQSKLVNFFIIFTFTLLYLFVSIISMIHTVAFFQLSNPYEILAISLAVAFELGAAASLATVVTQDAMSKFIVWSLFIILTLFQMMGNTYYAYHNLAEYSDWSELFALNELSEIEQKRYLSIISGAILPIVALGYIKCLVDYLKSKKKPVVDATDSALDDKQKEYEFETISQDAPELENKEEIKEFAKEILPEIKEKKKEAQVKVEESVNNTIVEEKKVEQSAPEVTQEVKKENGPKKPRRFDIFAKKK